MNYTLIDKTFLLKKTAPFRSLTLEMLLPIADKLAIAGFDRGDLIFDIGNEAHRMYFILEGSVQKEGTQCDKGDQEGQEQA